MKRNLGLVLVFVVFGMMVCNANAITSALSGLTNTAMVTAMNAPNNVTKITTITTATMYGGAMFTAPAGLGTKAIGNYQKYKWIISLTNLGNSTALFDFRMKKSNFWNGGGGWGWRFTNASPMTIPAGQFSNFGFIISNNAPSSNNAFFAAFIWASNRTANLFSKAYLGWGGAFGAATSNVLFGGRLSVGTNASWTNSMGTGWGPVVVLQHPSSGSSSNHWAGYLVAQIAGPVLAITKSIVSISHSSGLYSGDILRAEPGALITYRIFVTNSGSRAATNVRVVDVLSTNMLAFVSLVSQGRIFTNGLGAPVGNRFVFSASMASNNRFGNGPVTKGDRIVIKVRVR